MVLPTHADPRLPDNLAFVWGEVTSQYSQQSALAGAVGSDQADPAPWTEGEVDARKDGAIVGVHGDAVSSKHVISQAAVAYAPPTGPSMGRRRRGPRGSHVVECACRSKAWQGINPCVVPGAD